MEQMEFPLGRLKQVPLSEPQFTLPEGHFRQPEGKQIPLPGMEMTPQGHADDIAGRLTDLIGEDVDGRYDRTADRHLLEFTSYSGEPVADLAWHSTIEEPVYANGKTHQPGTKEHEEATRPGEISWIETHYPHRGEGLAEVMVAGAVRMGKELPEVTEPRMSDVLLPPGERFVRKVARKFGYTGDLP